jgi:hypothetical protein
LPAWTVRAAAALIALVCWTGLGLRFSLTYAHNGSAVSTAVIMLRYFTIIANLLVAVEMTRLALGLRISPFTLGGLTIAMILVGVVYGILLRNVHPLTGAALFASDLMHDVAPIAITLFWMFLVPHGRLRWTAPLWWSLLPIAYFIYAILRGGVGGRYPYFFMDVGTIGLPQTMLNGAAIAAAFIVSGYAMLWLDHRRLLGRRAASG